MLVLTDAIKQKIRAIHKSIGQHLPNYQPRRQQNYLVAEIAKTLGGEYDKHNRLCVIEAGTGTGKSLAYCLGVIPLAKTRDLKVVISTATVALQEQLLNKDLPFFARHSKLDFSFDIVKGRQRYVCGVKLEQFADPDRDEQDFGALFEAPPSKAAQKQLQKMHKAFRSGRWDGERDSWPTAIPEPTWQMVVSDKHSCIKILDEHDHCPYHTARARLDEMDVLIVNHALLLSDLELGGGIILPDPDETLYILDEAHHLPEITRDFASAQVTTKGAKEWLDKLPGLSDKLSTTLTRQKAIGLDLQVKDQVDEAGKALAETYIWLQQNHHSLFAEEKVHRFEHGVLPDPLLRKAETLAPSSREILKCLNKFQDLLKEELGDGDLSPSIAEPLLADLGFFIHRVENLNKLWARWAHVKSEKATPAARWIEVINRTDGVDYLLASAPIEVGFFLAEKLWDPAAGAVMCSATLTALNKFDFFRHQVGLRPNDGTQYLRVDSPFDYREKAELHLPKLRCEPSSPQFTDELVRVLPGILKDQKAALVLFSSYWQMEAVAEALEGKGMQLKVQGRQSRQVLIDEHKKAVDADKPSIVFGTQSFSEGLDLPGKYLTLVVITKLPFAVPTSPVEEAHAEYIKARGGNAFMELTIPQASKKLVQACGRLLRNENDTGKVVILDRRLVTKRYGQSLLDALPPFKRTIDY